MTIEIGIIVGIVCQIIVIAFGYGMLWQRVHSFGKILQNGLSTKVQEIHDDVLIIKTRCPLCPNKHLEGD